jgi:hypothetical protein
MDRPNQDLPTPLGAYNIAKLRSGKMEESNISLGGISMFKKSAMPIAFRIACSVPKQLPELGSCCDQGMPGAKYFLDFAT